MSFIGFSDPDTWTQEQIERARARIMHDTDPEVVADHSRRMSEWAERLGTPKRCKAKEVHPVTAECLFCGACIGQSCQLGFGG